MSDQFQRTIVDLWASLSLPEPVFGERVSIVLTIDATSIALEESADSRHIDLSSVAGRLVRDPVVQTMQIRDILRANLGTMVSFRASVSIDDAGQSDAEVVVRGVYPYEDNSIDRLVSVLGDVVSLSQEHGIKLHGMSASTAGRHAPEPNRVREEEFSMIFRP